MFIKYINKKGVIKYVKSITKGDDTSVEETKFSTTQMPHQDFMEALGGLGHLFASKNFREIENKIVIDEVSFEWNEIKGETKVVSLSCKYELYGFDYEQNKVKNVVGEISIKKQIPDEELSNAIETLITEAECFVYGKTGEPTLFNIQINKVETVSEQQSVSAVA